MNKWLQEDLCPIFDLDPSRVHTHSLRFAGASAMHTANEEDFTIMRMGRWASLAFLSYIKFVAVTFSRVVEALANRTTMTIQDVRNLMTSAQLLGCAKFSVYNVNNNNNNGNNNNGHG